MKKQLMMAAAVVLAVSAAWADEALVTEGKAFVEKKKCSMCHAIDGKGGKKENKPLNGIAAGKSAEQIGKILAGDEKTAAGKAHVPKFKLTDDELKALVAYLQSLL